jgi:mannose-6-phosphate isomerase-like protein (cupin superfamily)
MMSTLKKLFEELQGVIDKQQFTEGRLLIQDTACDELMLAITADNWPEFSKSSSSLSQPFIDVMTRENANSICKDILEIPFDWRPPETSDDPLYVAHSHTKAHIELLGPDGIIPSKHVRLGLYGILPNSEYGIRTHPAEEVFIMLAGEADWLRGTENYHVKQAGEYSYHPSGMRHATRTNDLAFMSVYIWSGDVSTEGYQYLGIPN